MSSTLKILFVCPYIPSPIRVRPYNIIKHLASQGHKITLLALIPPGEDTGSLNTLHQWCHQVKTVPLPRWRTLWNAAWAIPGQTPLQAAYSRSPAMSKLLQEIQKTQTFDVVHVEHLRGAELTQAINGIPIVFDSVDSIALLFEHVLNSGPNWKSRLMARLDLARTRRYEGNLLKRFSRVLVTSPKDKAALSRLSTIQADERLIVVPNGVDLEYFSPVAETRDQTSLIFTGKMSYHANIAAALDLAQKVMPLVWQKIPAAKLVIAGKDPAAEIQALRADERITITGTVPDLRPYLAKATVSVSPIRYGVGIQNKVLEAMAMATPVITTPQALTSLQAKADEEIIVADAPETIAEAALKLLSNSQYAHQVGQSGRHYVENYHDWNVTARNLTAIYKAAALIDPAKAAVVP